VAVEVIVRFPFTAPAVVGANETRNCGEFCPAFNVSGVVIPLTLKPAPVIATLLTVTLELPVFLMISDRGAVLPTFTLPKPRLVGLAANAPGVTPVADTGMVSVEFVAVEVTMRLPFTGPDAVGINDTVKVAFCPALSVKGVAIPLTLRPAPVIPTFETVTLEAPVLVIVSWIEL